MAKRNPGHPSNSGEQSAALKLPPGVKLLRTLEGHSGLVHSVVFDPQGGTLASGDNESAVKLWEAHSGKLLRTLEGHLDNVLRAVFHPQGELLASGSEDNTVNLWVPQSGKLLRTLQGHQGRVFSVAFDPQGRTLASGSYDKTVKLWEARSGRLVRTLEGHIDGVEIVGFSPDGRLLASKSHDHTVRLWNCETWETIAAIPETTSRGNWVRTLAFHPTLPLLATAGSVLDAPKGERPRLIHLWELDYDILLGAGKTRSATRASVHYAVAKVLLVGDTGVGKSGLAERLVNGKFVATKSSHARKAHVLESKVTPEKGGGEVHRETVLWDLAGQPAY